MDTNKRQRKDSSDVCLKNKIIEFMRDRPFLWDNKHPHYKDIRKRDNEFHQFSRSISYPITDIKRTWHILRTNFFRAHKMMMDRPQNIDSAEGTVARRKVGCRAPESREKIWKYYQAMQFILEATPNSGSTSANTGDTTIASSDGNTNRSNSGIDNKVKNESTQEDLTVFVNEITRQVRSSKMLKDSRGFKRGAPLKLRSQQNQSTPSSSGHSLSIIATPASTTTRTDLGVSTASPHEPIATTTPEPTQAQVSPTSRPPKTTNATTPKTGADRYLKSHRTRANNRESINSPMTTPFTESSTSRNPTTRRRASGSIESSMLATYDSDEDHLYARSLSSTLKKFDATTKEVIKLKFQEIIVEFMHNQQLIHQLGEQATSNPQFELDLQLDSPQ